MDILLRNNVKVEGQGKQTIVFVHGYGCDQNMWRFVAPQFQSDHRIVHFDLTGMGQSDLAAYDFSAYRTLHRHAKDMVDILEALNVTDCVAVGHSVGGTIASLAAYQAPARIKGLALVSPSPFFMNDGAYTGGFDRETLDGLVDLMEQNFFGWTEEVTPIIGGDATVSDELSQSFCRTDPDIAKHFGRVTFLSDHREDMKNVTTPAIIIQCRNDLLAPVSVGTWLVENMQNGQLDIIDATGHCPHLSDPESTVQSIRNFLPTVA